MISASSLMQWCMCDMRSCFVGSGIVSTVNITKTSHDSFLLPLLVQIALIIVHLVHYKNNFLLYFSADNVVADCSGEWSISHHLQHRGILHSQMLAGKTLQSLTGT